MRFADPITDQEYKQYFSDIKEYVSGKPIQYIVGVEWFWIPFESHGSYIDSTSGSGGACAAGFEKCLEGKGPRKVLDIGTGSGAIAIAMKSNVRRMK